MQDVPTLIVSWTKLNTTSVPQTHPTYNESSWVGTGMWSLETICYNVFHYHEVLEDLLDLYKRLAKAHCVNCVMSSCNGPVTVHQQGEPNNAIEWDFFRPITSQSTSKISEVDSRIKSPTTAHQALSMGY